MTPQLKFFHTPATCSTAAHIVLEESGLPYEKILVKLWKSEEQEKYRVTTNSRGTVPALEVDGELLTENVAIMIYVASVSSELCLLPQMHKAYAQCVSFLAWLASSVQLARRQARAPQRFTSDESTFEALKAAAVPVLWKHMQAIDKRLAEKIWIMGDQYTIADAYALVFYNWGVIDERDVLSLTHFTAFKNRMIERPAVRRALEAERSALVSNR